MYGRNNEQSIERMKRLAATWRERPPHLTSPPLLLSPLAAQQLCSSERDQVGSNRVPQPQAMSSSYCKKCVQLRCILYIFIKASWYRVYDYNNIVLLVQLSVVSVISCCASLCDATLLRIDSKLKQGNCGMCHQKSYK